MAATLWSRVASSSRLRSSERPLGSPIIPVAPPARAIGGVPGVLEPPQHDQPDEVAVVEAVGGRVAAVVERDRTLGEAGREGVPVGRVVEQPTRVEVGEQVHRQAHVGTSLRAGRVHRRVTDGYRVAPWPDAERVPRRWPRRASRTPPACARSCSPSSPARRARGRRCTTGWRRASPPTPSWPGCCCSAPPMQRQPVLLFACVHDLLLAGRADDGPGPLLPEPRRRRPTTAIRCRRSGRSPPPTRDELAELLATRSTQTNEIGRCALLLPAFGLLAAEVGPARPPRRRRQRRAQPAARPLPLHATSRAASVGAPSTVELDVRHPRAASGCRPRMPAVVERVGLDRSPVDVARRRARRAGWRRACGPTRPTAFERLQAALGIAARDRPRASDPGDAVADTAALVLARRRPSGRHQHVGPQLPVGRPSARPTSTRSTRAVAAATSRGCSPRARCSCPSCRSSTPARRRPRWCSCAGARAAAPARHLAQCHPHGYWLHWR